MSWNKLIKCSTCGKESYLYAKDINTPWINEWFCPFCKQWTKEPLEEQPNEQLELFKI